MKSESSPSRSPEGAFVEHMDAVAGIDDERLERLRNQVLGPDFKGLPAAPQRIRLGDIGRQGWNVMREDVPLPVMTLRRSALEHNLRRMSEYCETNGVELAPHGKTTMAPQLFKLQLDAGCWGITAATAEQLLVYREFGVRRVLFANQLAGRANVDLVAHELEDNDWEFYSFVDSTAAVEQLTNRTATLGARPFRVLLEVGYPGGRSGIRDLSGVQAIADAIRNSRGRVELVGVAGYEGLMPTEREPAKEANMRAYLRTLGDAADLLDREGELPERFLLTAGGSAGFDHVVEELGQRWPGRATLILRSGCYITHDHDMYAHSSPLRMGDDALRPALELWSYVQSIPEAGVALLTFGRRDASHDHGYPVPIRLVRAGSDTVERLDGCAIREMNDQHAYLTTPPNVGVRVGDRVILGISHPCTAFDKWRIVLVVDDDENVVDAVLTFF